MPALIIQTARERSGLTQAVVAQHVGVDRAHLSRLERGDAAPSADVLDRLCDVLGLTPDERSEALRQAGEAARARRAANETAA